MAPPSVNTHTHTLDLTHHNVCFRDPIRYTCQLCIPNTRMQAPIPTLCISAKKTHNKGSRTRPIMSTLMPRSGIPVICSRATLSCDSSYCTMPKGLLVVFYPYGIKLVSWYHALGIHGERTTLIWNKIQNLEMVSV